MAKRTIYIVTNSNSMFCVDTQIVEFTWHPGLSLSQKQKSIHELHSKIRDKYGNYKILEISSKSESEQGRNLSAFNLKFLPKNHSEQISVEVAFQASKVFTNGGPYLDILHKTSVEAKKDVRLKSSGELQYFQFLGKKWGLEPKTLFYDWLYMLALNQNPKLADFLLNYDCFTDIEFNYLQSINCQAQSAALYVAIIKSGMKDIFELDNKKYLTSIKKFYQNIDFLKATQLSLI